MRTTFLGAGILVVTCGCAQRTYEIDLSHVNGFEWNGKLRITETQQLHIGPFLSFNPYWAVSRVEVPARDGRSAVIATLGDEPPTAHVGLNRPMPLELVGVTDFWNLDSPILLADPAKVAESLASAATQPAATQPADTAGCRFWQPPEKLRPYSEHIAELGLLDWWAVALAQSDEVSLDFAGPEGLHIVMRGNPHRHGPAVLEVRSGDGQVLARFERQQLAVKPVSRRAK